MKNGMLKMVAAMVLLFGMSLATNCFGTPAGSFAFWDVFSCPLTATYNGSDSWTASPVYGDIRAVKLVNNYSGSDVTFTLYDEAGTVVHSKLITAGTTYYNRSIANYTVFGAYTVSLASNFTTGGSFPLATAVDRWPLAEGTGNTTTGSLGSDTLELGVSAATRPAWNTSTDCAVGNCVTLDGSNDYLKVNNSAALNFTRSNAFTVSLWIKPTAAPATNKTYYLFHTAATVANSTLARAGARIANDTSLVFVANTNSSIKTLEYTGASGLFNGSAGWQMLTFTYNSTGQQIFLNGVKVANQTYVASTLNNTVLAVFFGDGYDTGNTSVAAYFSGSMDEIYKFNNTLTDAQIGYLYNQIIPIRASATVISRR